MSYQSRSCIRIPVDLKAHFVFEDGMATTAQISDVSVTGFRVVTRTPYVKGQELVLRVQLPGADKTFDLPVQVMRVDKHSRAASAPVLGLKILYTPEDWAQTVGPWILRYIENRKSRTQAALLLYLGAGILVLKSILSALQIHIFDESSNFGELGMMAPLAQVLGQSSFTYFLGCLCAACGWTVLTPRPQDRIFSGYTALVLSGLISLRLIFKLSLWLHPVWGWIIYLADAILAASIFTGSLMMLNIEKHYKQYHYMLRREGIYPAED